MIGGLRSRLLDRLVLRPTRHRITPEIGDLIELPPRPGDRGPALSSLRIAAAGGPVARTIVCKFPGNAGRAERSSAFPGPALGREPTVVWTWNPPGYGQSGGRASMAAMPPAAIEWVGRVVDWERQNRSVDPNQFRLILCGNSIGCCAALAAASSSENGWRDRIDGIILRNPPALGPVIRRVALRYPMGPRLVGWLLQALPETMDATRTIGRVDPPVVWIASQCDTLVPIDLQRRIIDSHPGRVVAVLLEGAGHNDVPTADHRRHIDEAIERLFGHPPSKISEPDD